MKVRILSDLHLDVNEKHPFELKDKETFTILCGDISGNPKITTEWIRNNVHHGVFVSGNHLVYNHEGKTIDELREDMYKADTGDCTYLDCMVQGCPIYRKLDEKTVIIGSTMYTDFTLGARKQDGSISDSAVTRNMYNSECRMNDYRWGRVRVDAMKTRHLNAKDVEAGFRNFFPRLKIAAEEIFKDKNIIVVTHYCPSIKCISRDYLESDVNASYVVPLDDFIKKHPNIRLWCCGHVHHQDVLKVGRCKIVMNPRGYVAHCEDYDFDSRLWVDTETWAIHKHKKLKAEKKDFDERSDNLLKCTAWLM